MRESSLQHLYDQLASSCSGGSSSRGGGDFKQMSKALCKDILFFLILQPEEVGDVVGETSSKVYHASLSSSSAVCLKVNSVSSNPISNYSSVVSGETSSSFAGILFTT